MGIGLVILFWIVVAGFLLAVYLALSAFAKTRPRAALLRKVFVAFAAALAIPLGLLALLNFSAGFFPSHVFRSSFGFFPPADVTELKGSQSSFGDSGSAYLCFRADKVTVEKIIRSRRFVEDEAAGLKTGDLPDRQRDCRWPGSGSVLRRFTLTDADDTFQHSYGVLLYEESTGRVYFQWEGID